MARNFFLQILKLWLLIRNVYLSPLSPSDIISSNDMVCSFSRCAKLDMGVTGPFTAQCSIAELWSLDTFSIEERTGSSYFNFWITRKASVSIEKLKKKFTYDCKIECHRLTV